MLPPWHLSWQEPKSLSTQQVAFQEEADFNNSCPLSQPSVLSVAINYTDTKERQTCTGIYCLSASSADTPSACTSPPAPWSQRCDQHTVPPPPPLLFPLRGFVFFLLSRAESFLCLENDFALMFTSAVCFFSKCLKISVHPVPASSVPGNREGNIPYYYYYFFIVITFVLWHVENKGSLSVE